MLSLKEYIDHKGVMNVAREVDVEPSTVSHWKALKAVPRPHTAAKLIELNNNLLSWESIYKPFVDHNNESQLIIDFEGVKS